MPPRLESDSALAGSTSPKSIDQLDPRQRQLLFERIRAKRSASTPNPIRAKTKRQDPLEASLKQHLRGIWKKLLKLPEIDPQLSFFELGGHSLQITEMKFRIRQQLNLDIPIAVLYELATIDKLSAFMVATHGHYLRSQSGSTTQRMADGAEDEGTL